VIQETFATPCRPRLDAAVALLDRRLGDEFAVRRVVEVSLYIALHGRLIALEREEIIGAVRDDLVGDVDLTAHGVDGDERAREPIGFGELVEQFGNGGDFVGFLGNRELRQGQPGVRGVSAERMQRLQPLAFVAAAPRVLPSMAMKSWRPGQSAAIQLSKHRPNMSGSMRLTRSRSQRSLGMPK